MWKILLPTATNFRGDYKTSATTVVSESGGDVTYALGLEYDTGQRNKLFYRFMGSHHKVGDFGYDVNGVSAEMVWRFP